MQYKPVKTKKSYEQVADTLLEKIKSGQLQPGDKLDSVTQLAKSFEVSQSVIREALSGLRAMGLLTMRQGEGTYVSKYDASKFSLPVSAAFIMKKEDVKELFEVRRILEAGAAASAALHHTEKDMEAMKKVLLEMEEAIGNGELGEQADYDFHLAIVKASQNKMLTSLLSSVSDIMAETIRETRRLVLFSEGRDERLLQEHRKIFEAIQAKNPNEARKNMVEHLIGVEKLLEKYIY